MINIFKTHLVDHCRAYFSNWVAKRHPPTAQTIQITQKRLYILPTRFGYVFALTLFVMFLGAINYNNNMAFILTFLLAALAINVLWFTHRNLHALSITPLNIEPVFSGQHANVSLSLASKEPRPRYSVGFQWKNDAPVYANVIANEPVPIALRVKMTQRGIHSIGRFLLFTRFPLGLFHCWSWVDFKTPIIVYPKPGKSVPIANISSDNSGTTTSNYGDGEDFSGHKKHYPGEAIKRIDWKVHARERGLMHKQFSGQTHEDVWIDAEQFSHQSTEQRLSLLCRQVIDTAESGQTYGFKLFGLVIEPSSGEQHKRSCLKALAMYRPQVSHRKPTRS
ncbi:MAG: DUF58 domain-containing protein [Gammaproteobacteria bacterium]|nr:DUF58 domain-containing protein [Gammaproteobacteria bacterium]